MVDISLEILATSVPIHPGYLPRYRVKTWWCHIDVPPDVTFIKLPRLPMIQPFLIMTGKDTTLFIETWQDSQSAIIPGGGGGGDLGLPLNKTRFLGLTTCHVDEQLKTPNLNPSVQWVDVHNPVENQNTGKLLVKIDARFCMSSNDAAPITSPRGTSLTNQDSPIKMVQSPRRTGNYFDNRHLNGYHGGDGGEGGGRMSSIQNIASRKSDTSVYSIASSVSNGGREQAIQTDLSIDTDGKITTTTYHDKDKLSPLEAAKKLLSREALPPRGPPRMGDGGQRGGGDGDFNKRAYQMNLEAESSEMEQVIDILNNARVEESVTRGQSQLSNCSPPKPLHHARILEGVTKVGLPSLEHQVSSGCSSKRVSISSTSTTTGASSQDNQYIRQNLHRLSEMDDKPLTRFREVHFDGNRAKEQAKVLVMTRQTAHQGHQGPPVVTRRRIAAAIFND